MQRKCVSHDSQRFSRNLFDTQALFSHVSLRREINQFSGCTHNGFSENKHGLCSGSSHKHGGSGATTTEHSSLGGQQFTTVNLGGTVVRMKWMDLG